MFFSFKRGLDFLWDFGAAGESTVHRSCRVGIQNFAQTSEFGAGARRSTDGWQVVSTQANQTPSHIL